MFYLHILTNDFIFMKLYYGLCIIQESSKIRIFSFLLFIESGARHRVATSSCRRHHVDELATEPFLLLHREQGRIKTLGAPCQRVMAALPFPPLPFPLRPFPPPSPPSRSLFCHISPFLLPFSFRSGHLNTAMGPGSAVSSPSGVWGEN